MTIEIRGAGEHNLRQVDLNIGDGLTVVTGVSGSGKTSLVFDTLYHEARRRFLDIFSLRQRLNPADVRSITGLGPAVAVGQNRLNRNPNSILATASGLHPFLRLLYANFGERRCPGCGGPLRVFTEDEIVERVTALSVSGGVLMLKAPLLRGALGSHRTLLQLLADAFGQGALWVDGRRGASGPLDAEEPHDLDVQIAAYEKPVDAKTARQALALGWSLGAMSLMAEIDGHVHTMARAPVCTRCGRWFGDLSPVQFHQPCPQCDGEGCVACDGTGLHPEASAVRWAGLQLPDLLALSVDDAMARFQQAALPSMADRLVHEITRRLAALQRVGLGYVGLDRPLPTLSRGESQRVRLAIALVSRMEDILHVLDEPTIGQHPADVARLLPAFRDLAGPVVYVEHDRLAAAFADRAVDLGPGAGREGGRVVFEGTPSALWQADTATGQYFSLQSRVTMPDQRPVPEAFLTARGASLRNLKHVDVSVPLGRLTVITGVSGSGKSTLVEDVLAASLDQGEPMGCEAVEGPALKTVMVDQDPIGRNPRSNPATYTKLASIIRNAFANATGLSTSHFSFNRKEGACPACKGLGAIEVEMRYMPSTWIPCAECEGHRFKDEILKRAIAFGEETLSIADVYDMAIDAFRPLIAVCPHLSDRRKRAAERILRALCDIGLGYVSLGQPSPTLSGGEAQRVKLAKFLGKRKLSEQMLILDEPSTGLHPQDVSGLLTVLDRLVRSGATVIVVEHNTDIIRAADWVIDLGPGAGPEGGEVLYAGPPGDLPDAEGSLTGRALREEDAVQPRNAVIGGDVDSEDGEDAGDAIVIRGARAHNLRNVDVRIPKNCLTVVTGVSGSGKSSLVRNVLEAEAQRRFLETLSLYERQGTREGPEAPVDEVSGLGVAVTIEGTSQVRFGRRDTVGRATELTHHLAVLFSYLGERDCPECGTPMDRVGATRRVAHARRHGTWRCPSCECTFPVAAPRHFSPSVYAAACTTCHGVGTLRAPNPDKLIIHPEKPICDGAMYSPGFFPKGYLCKPMNGGYEVVQALAACLGFDPARTPWDEMSAEAQEAFLFGFPEKLRVVHQSRNGSTSVRQQTYPGFYGWIRDWDTGGTYTDTRVCPDCGGARLRPAYAAVTLAGHSLHAMTSMTLVRLLGVMEGVPSAKLQARKDDAGGDPTEALVTSSLRTVRQRLAFLLQVRLGYLHLDRDAATLSAGEAQRVKLAGLLGSGLTSLTVLLDEPTRGMHPSEVDALVGALEALRDEGNTVVVVEHDLEVIRAADHVIDMGPGAGRAGGAVVASGTPDAVARAETLTGRWLQGVPGLSAPEHLSRAPERWMTIRGARAHNLRGEVIRLPLQALVGVCGVSGSGKSTLVIDTLGRALAPKKQTTSVAYEPVDPGAYDALEGAPQRTVVVDQVKAGLYSPTHFLRLTKPFHMLFAEGEDAQVLGLDAKALGERCSVCNGRGVESIDMGFLPTVYTECEVCKGTGCRPEAWDVSLRGVALPDLFEMTIDEVYERFGDDGRLAPKLEAARDVGLGYLVLRQPGYALSGGEAQRLKIAKELCRRSNRETLYILDEPTVGQHLEDVARLVGVLRHLVAAGHSVLVVEHHPHLLAACDWLVELGPGGGPDGGRVIASGTPSTLARGSTPTAPHIRAVLQGTGYLAHATEDRQ